MEKENRLEKWQARFSNAMENFLRQLGKMEEWESLYRGTSKIEGNPNKQKKVSMEASNVQNIAYELIESQIDSNIPLPKVECCQKENEGKALIIEEMLKGQFNRLPMEMINDLDERTCPIQGGSWYLVEWDNTLKTHTTTGDITVTLLHPKQVILQQGITDWKNSDYLFITLTQTKAYIKRRYGVDLKEIKEEKGEHTEQSEQNPEELVTQVLCFFKNKKGGIGKISWVGSEELEYMEDYFARKLEVCAKCGTAKYEETCSCGSKTFETQDKELEELAEDITTETEIIPKGSKLPYYKPDVFPLVLRKNVSEYGKVLGGSDMEKIKDQQNAVKKINTVIDEKLFSGGSFVMLPEKKNIETTDSQLKVVRVKPEEVNLFRVINVQPDMNWEIRAKAENIKAAKDTLGITDSFQGKPDPTAQSGKAKEIAARQSSGRLESKRRMKDAAYQELFEILFKYMLAYADEPRHFKAEERGKAVYMTFNKYLFLQKDESGTWYYNDNFLFATDTAGALGSDRVYMWEQARLNLQSGVYGDPKNPKTLLRFWTTMESFHYPTAKTVRGWIEEDLQQTLLDQQNLENILRMQSMQKMQSMQGAQNTQQGQLPQTPEVQMQGKAGAQEKPQLKPRQPTQMQELPHISEKMAEALRGLNYSHAQNVINGGLPPRFPQL